MNKINKKISQDSRGRAFLILSYFVLRRGGLRFEIKKASEDRVLPLVLLYLFICNYRCILYISDDGVY